jgi:hypothetical protein
MTSFDGNQQVCRYPLRSGSLRVNAAGDGCPQGKHSYGAE